MPKATLTGVSQNTAINLVGSVVPVILSLVTIAPYLSLIGDARYGVLAMVWLLVGYFGVFNLGLGRAVANQIAALRDHSDREIKSLFWTVLAISVGFGVLGGAILFMVGHLLPGVLNVPAGLRLEMQSSAPLLGAAVASLVVQSVLTGALKGREHFLTVNSIGVLECVLSLMLPLAVAYWLGPDLVWLIGAVVLAKLLALAVTVAACFILLPVGGTPAISTRWVGTLVRYGGWITVSGIVGPLLTVVDQMAIGVQIGAQGVTYYNIPYNLVTRITILPSSLSRTLFPRFSTLSSVDARDVGQKSILALAILITPVVVVGQAILRPFLELWLGPVLSDVSAPVGQILLIGIWFNSLAHIPSVQLQGQGRPDLTAKFHLLELLPYLLALYVGMSVAGLPGAALAWALRAVVDSALLFGALRTPRIYLKSLTPAACLVLLAGANAFTNAPQRGWQVVLGVVLAAASLFWAWHAGSDIGLLPRSLSGAWNRTAPGDRA